MERLSAERVADWCDGRLVGGDPATEVGPDVVSDSRAITPGCLFVAIPGERVDGHDFVAAAADAGAAAALVERPVDAALPQIVVDDSVAALGRLAGRVVRAAQAAGLVVVGVTGSSGKTSTKDLIAQVLAGAGPTVAPVGSFNNELGAPLTAVKVDARTRFLVSEMGARGVGHIAFLCGITPPTIGAVLNVGTAHVGEFGSQDVIARAKGELVEALPADGWAVLNADDTRVAAMAGRTTARIARWSAVAEPTEPADLRVWASEVTADELQRHSFTLHAAGAVTAEARVTMGLLGRHQVLNALATATVALCAGLEPDAVADALSGAGHRSPWRMQLDERADGLAVLNDAYNANPDSMAAALATLGQLRRPGGRLVAVLGDMLELGGSSAEAHRDLGRLAADVGVDELVVLGGEADAVLAGFAASGRPGRYFADKADAAAHLARHLGGRDVVLVKASRGLGLETVAAALLKEGTDA